VQILKPRATQCLSAIRSWQC